MAFFINKLKDKAHNWLAIRMTPLEKMVAKQDVQHLHLMSALRQIADKLDPAMLDTFPDMAEFADNVTPLANIVVVPNYSRYLREDDVYLASYPRSGNTWVRTIIGYLLYPPETFTSLKDLETYLPDLHLGLPQHDRYSQPRVFKTHQPFHARHASENLALYKQFIYLLRHPFKVLMSYYDLEAHVFPDQARDLAYFIEKVCHNAYAFGGWDAHILSWQFAQKQASNALFMRYEDLQKQPIANIQRIAQFFGKPLDEAGAEQIRQLSSQEHMVELDKKGSLFPTYEFVRRGDERQTKAVLTDDLKAMIYEYNKTQMDAWGYLPDGSVAEDYPNKAKYNR